MMIMLSRDVLLPVRSKIPNPLSALFSEFESKASRETEWLDAEWPKIKRALLLRCLNKAHGLFFVKGLKTPSDLIHDAIIEMYQAINGSFYFSVQLRQAFFHFLNTKTLSSKYSQFLEEELKVIFDLLTKEELEAFSEEAKIVKKDYFSDRISLNFLFKTIQRSLDFLTNTRLAILAKRDAALYSKNDLKQHLNLQILLSLTNAHINRNERAWAITIAKNALQDVMNSSKIRTINTAPIEDNTLLDAIYVIDAEDKCFFDSLMRRADPKIQKYLRFLFGDENPEFWEWFVGNEPELAQREAYLQKKPQAILPWVQRWLGLGSYELISFFKEHYPELISSSPRKRA
jgi:hypothetical protein